ncbi:hypothetical protein [Streptacidiphilus jiangxiensis]|uniref:Uncharacterized protein n=1 Tax=Streptacidiphilus jiangxiensis TaxID=235985 RepID=A0A1H7ZLP1_STRJI|nr:hypothetical protein [Streptacidiphilus jiangxiensis]SEM59310.1 hypothetical protein SAMN05414137_13624 [Streptacidiphilus jiangxiensis]
MSVEAIEPGSDGDPRIPDIPANIQAIGPALASPAARLQFYAQAMAATAGAEIDAVLQRGRFQALLDQAGRSVPPTGGRRVGLEELAAPLGGVDALDAG